MIEQHVQEIMETEVFEPDNEWFKSVTVHKEDADVDMWFALAVQASCCPCLRFAGVLQVGGMCCGLLHAT